MGIQRHAETAIDTSTPLPHCYPSLSGWSQGNNRVTRGSRVSKTLTVKALDNIKPSSTRREVPDGGLPGLYLVVQPSGATSWAVRYRINGTPKKVTLGTYPAISLPDARSLARKALVAVSEGRDPSEERKAAKRAAREAVRDDIESVVSSFIERYAKLHTKPGSAEQTERLLRKEVVGAWRGRPVGTITRRDVILLLDQIVDRGAPVTANRVLAATRRMFRWAMERGLVDATPTEGIRAPSAEKARDRVLSDNEVGRVWVASDAIGWPFGSFIKMLVLTGQRRDEVAAMSWSELDLDNGLWTLPAERSKNGYAHVVPLAPAAVAILRNLPVVLHGARPSPFVFTTTGATHISGYSRAKAALDAAMLARLKKEAADRGEDPDEVELQPWRFHDLRRTMASGMARLGVSIHVVEKLLNHVSGTFGGIVGVYQRHDFAEEKLSAVNAWCYHVTSLLKVAR